MILTIKSNFPDIKIWIWTGYTWDQLEDRIRNTKTKLFVIIRNIDYLIAGPYVQEERDLTLLWRGSRNQEVIDIKESIRQGEKILYVQ